MKVITIASGKSGTGCTALSLAAAAILHEKQGLRCGVAEISSAAFDIPVYMGMKEENGAERTMPARFSSSGNGGLDLYGDTGSKLNVILDEAEKRLDVLFIDTNTIAERFLTAADMVLIPVVLDNVRKRHAVYTAAAIKSLKYPSTMVKLVVNMNETPGLEAEHLVKVLPGLNLAGILPVSDGLAKAMREGRAGSLVTVKDKFMPALENLLTGIINGINPKSLTQRKMEYDPLKPAADGPEDPCGGTPGVAVVSPEDQKRCDLKRSIYRQLYSELDIRKLENEALEGAAKKDRIHREIQDKLYDIFDRTVQDIKSRAERELVVTELFREVTGYGPIEEYLKDPAITEIMINRYDVIFVEKKGKLQFTGSRFTDDETVRRVMERIVMPLGRRIDDSKPYVDARLPDGSRVNAVIHPLALDGSILTIRKFSDKKLSIDDLIGFGSITRDAADYIRDAVAGKKNIIVSGGTGSGKTTLLNVLSSFIPHDERIITIEDSAELKLEQFHVVRLETRTANLEGMGAVTIRDLVINALRMRPDRIIVGECRGGEALDMLQAMNTGHEGSMTTLHANSPRDALSRLEVMILMAGVDLPVRAIREQIRGAVNIIVQQARMVDGSRKIVKITELKGMDNDTLLMEDVFAFEADPGTKEGAVTGKLVRKR